MKYLLLHFFFQVFIDFLSRPLLLHSRVSRAFHSQITNVRKEENDHDVEEGRSMIKPSPYHLATQRQNALLNSVTPKVY